MRKVLYSDTRFTEEAQASARKIVERSPDIVDRFAEREDEVGAVFRAIREAAGEGGADV